MENYDELINKVNLTNELLFRLCVGQRLLSNRDCTQIMDLIPRMKDHPCNICQFHCIEYDKKVSSS